MRRYNGEGSWDIKKVGKYNYIRFRKTFNGVQKEFMGKTRKEVLVKVNKYEQELNTNVDKKKLVKTTLEEYMYNWLINVRINTVGDNTYTTNIKDYETYIQDKYIGKTYILDIDAEFIQIFLNDLAKKYARSTIQRLYYLIRLCFEHMKLTHKIAVNPCDGVVMPSEHIVKKKKKKIDYLSTEQMFEFTNEIDRLNTKGNLINGKEGTRVYGVNAKVLVVIAYTGLRIGEMLALTWDDIDFNNKILHVRHSMAKKTTIKDGKKEITNVIKEPKYNSVRDIPLADKAIEALLFIKENRTDKSNYVCVAHSQNLSITLKSILKRAEIPYENFGLHSLRHTFGSVLLEQGVDLKVISELLGHKDISTTANIYVNVTPQLAKESINVLNTIQACNTSSTT